MGVLMIMVEQFNKKNKVKVEQKNNILVDVIGFEPTQSLRQRVLSTFPLTILGHTSKKNKKS